MKSTYAHRSIGLVKCINCVCTIDCHIYINGLLHQHDNIDIILNGSTSFKIYYVETYYLLHCTLINSPEGRYLNINIYIHASIISLIIRTWRGILFANYLCMFRCKHVFFGFFHS